MSQTIKSFIFLKLKLKMIDEKTKNEPEIEEKTKNEPEIEEITTNEKTTNKTKKGVQN